MNWRWWIALLPVCVVIVVLHAVAGIGIVMRDVFDWLSFRGWRLRCVAMQVVQRFTKTAHAWVFHAPPNYK